VVKIKRTGADVVTISAHPFSARGVRRAAGDERQGAKPKVLVGLTSITSSEVMEICGKQAEGMVVLTSFAPNRSVASHAAHATAMLYGYADLHSMAAWENVYAVKQAIKEGACWPKTTRCLQTGSGSGLALRPSQR